ncbi:predicted protein [Coccidioides posadasii str. Silveira]|uniref:Predicted protein n=2 Tax=Coccidioides posadasii TaxID=199306 RepID=E9D4M9_COCPS|nr:predicted protein [Coccidioides posadasii str. Silveira]KMM66159.1 hypothetical protein CPAG_02499 [Coccidioides posadasii RMSCC 3488]
MAGRSDCSCVAADAVVARGVNVALAPGPGFPSPTSLLSHPLWPFESAGASSVGSLRHDFGPTSKLRVLMLGPAEEERVSFMSGYTTNTEVSWCATYGKWNSPWKMLSLSPPRSEFEATYSGSIETKMTGR